MDYRFSLVLFYRACYKNERLYFRMTRRTDLPMIAEWMADMTGQPVSRAAQLLSLLQREWDITAGTVRRDSWIGMAGPHRLFLLEEGVERAVYITGPDILFAYPDLQEATWRLIEEYFPRRRH